MTKIVFHGNPVCERGTTVSTFDYAYYAREFFDIDPIFLYIKNHKYNDDRAIERFEREFETHAYENFYEVENYIDRHAVDYFYAIKCGNISDEQVSNAKNLMHSVYVADFNQIHGYRYATVSEWQSKLTNFSVPYVPHMVYLVDEPGDLRKELSIPKSALVLGRYGGWDTFDVPFIWESISDILSKRDDIWFLFMNTPKSITHPRCIFLDKTVDLKYKARFVNTTDAMLHGGYRGETFGIAILEFAIRNRQIIVFDNKFGGRNHHLYLDGRCHIYSSKESLGLVLQNITKQNPFDTRNLLYKFSPRVVMNKFQSVFLS